MRCKQGDLASVGYVPPEKYGHIFCGYIVTCVQHIVFNGKDCWITSPKLLHEPTGEELYCEDFLLTPIRPQPDNAEDEMVKLLGRPDKKHVLEPNKQGVVPVK